jgi:hypothetical protein
MSDACCVATVAPSVRHLSWSGEADGRTERKKHDPNRFELCPLSSAPTVAVVSLNKNSIVALNVVIGCFAKFNTFKSLPFPKVKDRLMSLTCRPV